ncbi:hypothetical protein PFISCL1PPCAC_9287 [Pristionchus fissidentatus]|uniref:Sulfatase N-terminal domain-containing protein n=1 Tax=Pristionchus fissidentatus TaxID=1538716 RepID=A0AAV5VE86_9BILA|nr:hypothetical protein PFISCL1PPCAC_9287 [Pristionchus fissidentatus]
MHIFLRVIIVLFVVLYGLTWLDIDYENITRILSGEELLGSQASTISSFQRTGLIDDIFDNCKLEVTQTWTSELKRVLNPLHDPMKSCNRSFVSWSDLGDDGRVWMRTEAPEQAECRARSVIFKTEFHHAFGQWYDVKEGHVFENDVVEVECQRSNTTVYQFLHYQIWQKQRNATSNSGGERNRAKIEEKKNKVDDRSPSVYIIVVDSIGASHGRRVFPQTLRYLQEEFGAVDMLHMNKVGENSRPNGIAFLFGKSITNIKRDIFGLPPLPADWNLKEFCKTHLDGRGFILKEFEKRGYTTMMAEDWHQGVFNWPSCYGFKKEPTTHYMRPFQLRLNKDHPKVLRDNMSSSNCFEQHLHLNGYMEKFMRAYPNTPKIAMTWASNLGHDSANLPFHADKEYRKLFERNRDELDNSFVVFMGDHGLRFGKLRWTDAGKRDINNPMMIVSVPRWLRNNTTLMANLNKNAQELLTMFDLHATLLDISESSNSSKSSDFSETIVKPDLRGSSFLRPLPSTPRNCKTLPIPPQYCLCKVEKEKENITSELSSSVGESIALDVNERLAEWNVTEICARLEPEKLTELQRVVGARDLYEATVKLRPGGGSFQTFVRRDEFNASSFSVVVPDVTRLDKYGRQADCTQKNEIRPLCFCKGRLAALKGA